MATITKLNETVSNPNGIDINYTQASSFTPKNVIIGECYYFGSLSTTPVISIESKDAIQCTFKTKNSTYQIKY